MPIASGGMARVILARDTEQGDKPVAVKVLHAHVVEQEDCVTMLLDEARLASQIDHPNVLPVFEVGFNEDGPYLVMEYIEGGSLAQALRNPPQPDKLIPIILTVVVDVLRGLSAAHSLRDEQGHPLSVIHRDLSPQNVMLDVAGNAMVTDFGIAKAEMRLTVTRPGARKGKAPYMSPEQIRGHVEVSPASDTYSMGVLLYNALTGSKLFRGINDITTMHNVLTYMPPKPSRVRSGIPEQLDRVIMKSIAKDPKARYQSAEAMEIALLDAASECARLATRSEVSRWVETACAETLKARRLALYGSANPDVKDERTEELSFAEVAELMLGRRRSSGVRRKLDAEPDTVQSVPRRSAPVLASNLTVPDRPEPELADPWSNQVEPTDVYPRPSSWFEMAKGAVVPRVEAAAVLPSTGTFDIDDEDDDGVYFLRVARKRPSITSLLLCGSLALLAAAVAMLIEPVFIGASSQTGEAQYDRTTVIKRVQ